MPPQRILLQVGLMLWVVGEAAAVDPGRYRIGDIAAEDVIAPVQLIVIDPDGTEALKQKEAAKVPVICRYYTNAADEAEQRFRLAFSKTRSNFLDSLEVAYNRRKLGTQAVAGPKFLRTTTAFQKRNKGFPLYTNLAVIWATGQSDRVIQSSLVASLRETMGRPLRSAIQPPELRLGYSVRLVGLSDPADPLLLEDVERHGRNVARTNIMTVKRAREEFRQLFAPDEQLTAKFMSGLLRTNCVPDLELTSQARAKRTDPIWAADRYEPGQLIIARGQVVDKKIQAAIEQMHQKAAVVSLAQQAMQGSSRQRNLPPMWGSALVAMLLVLVGLCWSAIRRRTRSWVPAVANREAAVLSGPPGTEHLPARLRASLIPHLARLMMDRVVLKLLSQRSQLLDAQQKAVAEMNELEERLEKVHAPLQDRLRAYEQRIHELEKQLVRKGEENRELIKTKLELARHQLAAARNRLDLN